MEEILNIALGIFTIGLMILILIELAKDLVPRGAASGVVVDEDGETVTSEVKQYKLTDQVVSDQRNDIVSDCFTNLLYWIQKTPDDVVTRVTHSSPYNTLFIVEYEPVTYSFDFDWKEEKVKVQIAWFREKDYYVKNKTISIKHGLVAYKPLYKFFLKNYKKIEPTLKSNE